jgi:hypothetical protein
MSIAPDDIDSMLLREFASAAFNNRRAELARLSTRAVDKVYAEFALRGFAGFVVRQVDGRLEVDGITAAQLLDIPAHLQVKP